MEVLLDKNHPIVTSLALTVLNRLSARENKTLFTLSEHFKEIKTLNTEEIDANAKAFIAATKDTEANELFQIWRFQDSRWRFIRI